MLPQAYGSAAHRQQTSRVWSLPFGSGATSDGVFLLDIVDIQGINAMV